MGKQKFAVRDLLYIVSKMPPEDEIYHDSDYGSDVLTNLELFVSQALSAKTDQTVPIAS